MTVHSSRNDGGEISTQRDSQRDDMADAGNNGAATHNSSAAAHNSEAAMAGEPAVVSAKVTGIGRASAPTAAHTDKPNSSDTDRDRKRQRILDAAQVVFARRGFFAARVSEIAKEAGVADGTIYLYFKSKDDVLISLFESRMERLNAALAAAIAGHPPSAALHIFITRYLQAVADEPTAAEVLTIELRQSAKFMKEYENPHFAEFLRMLSGIIANGQTTGAFAATVPPHIVARALFGMLDELATAWLWAHDHTKTASKANNKSSTKAGATSASVSKKFDIVAAAAWVTDLLQNGLLAGRPPT